MSVSVKEFRMYAVLISDDVKDSSEKLCHTLIVPGLPNQFLYTKFLQHLGRDRTLQMLQERGGRMRKKSPYKLLFHRARRT